MPLRSAPSLLRRLCAALTLAVALPVLAALPAEAHASNPAVVTRLDSISPALPSAVVVQVQPSIADQLVAANPTPAVLEVEGLDGQGFLRISSAGVFANLTDLDWWTTGTPTGVASVPPSITSAHGSSAYWVKVSAGTSWGWFDHRLHPADQVVPPGLAQSRRPATLGHWVVPMRFGSEPVTVRGSVLYQPVIGGFLVTADPVSDPLRVQVLQGRLPGIFATFTGPGTVTVLGSDGRPFARLAADGVLVRTDSPTWAADRQARGLPVDTGPPRWLRVSRATTFSWLDQRLAWTAAQPSTAVTSRSTPTVLAHWSIPVACSCDLTALTGEIQWVPNHDQGATTSSRSVVGPLVVAILTVGVLAALGVVVRARRRRPAVS